MNDYSALEAFLQEFLQEFKTKNGAPRISQTGLGSWQTPCEALCRIRDYALSLVPSILLSRSLFLALSLSLSLSRTLSRFSISIYLSLSPSISLSLSNADLEKLLARNLRPCLSRTLSRSPSISLLRSPSLSFSLPLFSHSLSLSPSFPYIGLTRSLLHPRLSLPLSHSLTLCR